MTSLKILFLSLVLLARTLTASNSWFSFDWFKQKQPTTTEIIASLRSAQIDSPFDPEINYNLGTALYKNNDVDEAKEHLERCLQYADKLPEITSRAQFNLGNTHLKKTLSMLPPSWEDEKTTVESPILDNALQTAKQAQAAFEVCCKKYKNDKAKTNVKAAEYLIKKLEEKKKQQDKQNQDDKNKNQNDKDKQNRNQKDKNKSNEQDQQNKQNKNDDPNNQEHKENDKQKDDTSDKKDSNNGNNDMNNNQQKKQDESSSPRNNENKKEDAQDKQERTESKEQKEQGGEQKQADATKADKADGKDKQKQDQQMRAIQAMLDHLQSEEAGSQKRLLMQQMNKAQQSSSINQKTW